MTRHSHTRLSPSRVGEVLRGLGALSVFALLLAGVPIGLYTVAGSPIPDQAPTWDRVSAVLMRPDTDHQLFLSVVGLLGWSAWSLFTVVTCVETISYFAGRTMPCLPRPVRPLQVLARDLVATVTLAFGTTAAALSTPAAATAHATTHAQPPPADKDTPEHGAPPAGGRGWEPLLGAETTPRPEPDRPKPRTRIIRRGDTLWGLARRTYGSGELYPKIFKASRNIAQPPGVPALTDPDTIHPGQRVRIPRTRTKTAAPSPAHTPSRTQRPAKPAQGQSSTAQRPPRPRSAAEASKPSQVPTPIVAPPVNQPPATQDTGAERPTSGIWLPSGSYIGLGLAAAISLAVAATRLHRRRRRVLESDTAQPAETHASALPTSVVKARKAHLDDSRVDQEAPLPSDADLIAHDHATPAPDHITIGTRGRTPLTLPLPGLNLGLSGDAAHAAARAITTELLAKARRDRAELLLPHTDAHTLYPDSTLTGIPGLTLTPNLSAALTQLEAEVLRRARLLETTDQTDLAALRAADPAEPLPTLLLVASVPEQTAATVHAITQLGHRYGIGALALGPCPTGTTLHLNHNATVTRATGPHADPLTQASLFHLTADDATAILHTLRTAAGTPEPETPTPPPANAGSDPENSGTGALPVPPPRSSEEDRPRPARLQLLGPVLLHTAEGPVTTGVRRSARDLLAYLALHPDGITRDQAIGALWPDHNPDTATSQFNTAIANIRKTLRTATGLREPMYVIHATGRYRLDPHLIDIDLWNLNTALTNARRATTDTDRITSLTPVPNLYTADFATDLTHHWAEHHREYLRRTATDALAQLARLLQHHHPDQALTVLEQAITHDPYAEPLYRNLMQLQAQLGHPDAAQRTYRFLTTRLADLDTEPEDQTHQLLTKIQRHQIL